MQKWGYLIICPMGNEITLRLNIKSKGSIPLEPMTALEPHAEGYNDEILPLKVLENIKML